MNGSTTTANSVDMEIAAEEHAAALAGMTARDAAATGRFMAALSHLIWAEVGVASAEGMDQLAGALKERHEQIFGVVTALVTTHVPDPALRASYLRAFERANRSITEDWMAL